MGMNTDSGNGGRAVLSEINVTPFVDVMLVLLVIFMVTAPILYQGVDVNLPKTESKPMPAAEREQNLVLTVNSNGEIFIEKDKYTMTQLKRKIRSAIAAKGGDPNKEDVFLRADTSVPYGTVIEIMSELQQEGIYKIGLITEPSSDK